MYFKFHLRYGAPLRDGQTSIPSNPTASLICIEENCGQLFQSEFLEVLSMKTCRAA